MVSDNCWCPIIALWPVLLKFLLISMLLDGCSYFNWPSLVGPQSLRNRSFLASFCCLLTFIFLLYEGFCHMSWSDLFFFLSEFENVIQNRKVTVIQSRGLYLLSENYPPKFAIHRNNFYFSGSFVLGGGKTERDRGSQPWREQQKSYTEGGKVALLWYHHHGRLPLHHWLVI